MRHLTTGGDRGDLCQAETIFLLSDLSVKKSLLGMTLLVQKSPVPRVRGSKPAQNHRGSEEVYFPVSFSSGSEVAPASQMREDGAYR